jgi:hypothetical protein
LYQPGVKDVRRNGHGGGIRRYAVAAESASTAVNSSRFRPGLVTGELAHICESCLFKSCITGRSSAPGKI